MDRQPVISMAADSPTSSKPYLKQVKLDKQFKREAFAAWPQYWK
jgi:hypothetical protein